MNKKFLRYGFLLAVPVILYLISVFYMYDKFLPNTQI